MTNSILITGGSGMIGRRLTEILLQKGSRVSHLGRFKVVSPSKSFVWDVKKGILEQGALEGVDTIIHLAGAGIADKRWTAARKREILESRIQSTALLFEHLRSSPHSVRTIVSASAIGYYGFGTPDQIFTEESPPGNDFLSTVVCNWEKEVDKLESLGIRVVKIRIGIVLSKRGGALWEMARPVRWFVGAPLGTGQQVISWIHVEDLCRVFVRAVEDDSLTGVFNTTAGTVTNRELTELIGKALNRKIWLPAIPAFVLRMILGEVADAVVNGSNVSSVKIIKSGFVLEFPELSLALQDLLNSKDSGK